MQSHAPEQARNSSRMRRACYFLTCHRHHRDRAQPNSIAEPKRCGPRSNGKNANAISLRTDASKPSTRLGSGPCGQGRMLRPERRQVVTGQVIQTGRRPMNEPVRRLVAEDVSTRIAEDIAAFIAGAGPDLEAAHIALSAGAEPGALRALQALWADARQQRKVALIEPNQSSPRVLNQS